MNELIEFLRAQLDEDERVASGARPGRWATRTDSIGEREVYSVTRDEALGGDSNVFPDAWHEGSAEHAARWDPARVLAEVDVKRRILDEYEDYASDDAEDHDHAQFAADARLALEPVVKLLALPYAGKPDYREEWRP